MTNSRRRLKAFLTLFLKQTVQRTEILLIVIWETEDFNFLKTKIAQCSFKNELSNHKNKKTVNLLNKIKIQCSFYATQKILELITKR